VLGIIRASRMEEIEGGENGHSKEGRTKEGSKVSRRGGKQKRANHVVGEQGDRGETGK